MKTIYTIFAICAFTFSSLVQAQTLPQVAIPAADLITVSSSQDYSFSKIGHKIGIVRTGNATVSFTGVINFRNDDTLYIGEGVAFNPEFINGFSSGCLIINGGTANLDDCAFTGGQIDNYGVMTASYLGVSNFILNNYGSFKMVNGCSLNASQINNHGSLVTGYLGMTGDASSILNSTDANMVVTSSGRIAANGSKLRNDGNLTIMSFFTTDAATFMINNGRMHTAADFNIGGTVVNKGMLISGGKMNIAAGASFTNSCRVVTTEVSNAADKMSNYGFFQVTTPVYGAFTNSGTVKNAGYIRATQFFNTDNGTIINALNNSSTNNQDQDGFIRIEGGADGFESVNYGTITGGKIGDASNPAYALDTTGPAMTATVTAINAYDTATYQNAPMLPCNCGVINQLTANATVQLAGTQYSSYNDLNWQFSAAPDVVSVALQAATNEQDYTVLQTTSGLVQANGSYQHSQPASPVYYYRLKVVAADSSVSFSNIVRLGMPWAAGIAEQHQAATTAAVSCYPNPFAGDVHIDMTAQQNEQVRVIVYDLAGRVVTAVDFNAHTGSNNFNVSGLGDLAPGMYVLQLHTLESNQDFQFKIVKQ